VRSLIWTRRALVDLARTRKFLALDNPAAASRAVKTIRSVAVTLQSTPEIGRIADPEERNYREWFIPFGASAFVVLYRADEEEIVLVAIRHSREAGY
jgi:plasmid stabilization system protein ParE